jgi:hypothetical protein
LILAPQFVSVLNRDGEVTDQILDAEGHEVPVIRAALDRATREWQPQFDEASLSPTEHVRIITWPARDEEGETFFVVVGQSLRDIQPVEKQLSASAGRRQPASFWRASAARGSPKSVEPGRPADSRRRTHRPRET